ncbi:MAG: hypothetical protein AAGG44_10220 [Planctomycetota bacterium]
MPADETIDKLIRAAEKRGFGGSASGQPEDESASLLGIFQLFRPDGIAELGIFSDLPGGPAFEDRLARVFTAVGDGGRGDGLKDAYFVIRNPPAVSEAEVQRLAELFLNSCLQLDLVSGQHFDPPPKVRVLEGKPPKHPKSVAEQAPLLRRIQKELPDAIAAILNANSIASRLEEALYFMACDRWLRDYLRWPLAVADAALPLSNEDQSALASALEAYFSLWSHGIKFRIFSSREVDFYLPRRTDGTLIDAGQFATKHSNGS